MKNNEKRQFQRVQFEAPVQLEQGQLQWQSEMVDVSLKGILVKDDGTMFDQQQLVSICLTLSEDAAITMQAAWSHNNNGAHGFRWQQVDIESMIHLRRLLELNSVDGDLLERELGLLSNDETNG